MNEDVQTWADKLLASISMPASATARDRVISLGADACLYLDLLVTDEVVDTIWGMWNPDQPDRIKDKKFRKAFKHMLSEGVRLGFRLNRFRDVSESLPDPDDETAWAAVFEGVIAGRDRCKARLYFCQSQYHSYMRSKLANENVDDAWDAKLTTMRDGLFYELGIVYPPFDVMLDESLEDGDFRIEWNDLRLPPRKGIDHDHALVNDTVDRLKLLNVQGETAINPANGSECALIKSADVKMCESAGLTTWDNKGYMILMISSVLRRAGGAFINRYLIWYFLNAINDVWPTLVSEVKKQINIDLLVQILRGLIDEQISVRDSRTIFESLLSSRSRIYADASKYILFANHASGVVLDRTAFKHRVTVTDYVNLVRIASKRYISHKYTRGQNTLIVYLLDPAIERRLRRAQSLSPLEHKELLDAVRYEVGSLPPTAQNPVILTTHDIRLRMRTEIRHEFPHLAVLSYQELSPDMNIQPIARISTDDWLYNRSEQWSRHYALRIEESYSLLLKAVAARSGSGAAIS
ncbi:MAG: FHIPEP family type III secretion protein, partial [Acidobacteria bacterium]|nr:FHIPEP family type III secretion protein [Acidobacteriota bacterium]